VSGFSEARELLSKEKTERALSEFLRPEFINRIDEIITFRHLTKSDFVRIADIMLGKLRLHLLDKGIKLVYTNELLEFIADGSYSEKYGARNMRRYIERNVEDRLANVLIENYGKGITGISLSVKDSEIKVNIL
jgi:ATP-dependent Clp protease ATP-binding subunit ClpA